MLGNHWYNFERRSQSQSVADRSRIGRKSRLVEKNDWSKKPIGRKKAIGIKADWYKSRLVDKANEWKNIEKRDVKIRF